MIFDFQFSIFYFEIVNRNSAIGNSSYRGGRSLKIKKSNLSRAKPRERKTKNCGLTGIRQVPKFYAFTFTFLLFALIGCEGRVRLPSAEQLAEFESAGSSLASIDWPRPALGGVVRAKMEEYPQGGVSHGGPYRVVPGDVLELTIPAILQVLTVEQAELPDRVAPYLCRVSEIGTVALPVVGAISVAGKSLAEIELAVIDAYYPMYTAIRPSVVARVTEYSRARVSITGAVKAPGVYELRSDQMTLIALLMEAGGIVDEGAAIIHIIHTGTRGQGSGARGLIPDPRPLIPDPCSEDTLYKQLAETYNELVKTLGLKNPPVENSKFEIRDSRFPPKAGGNPITLPVRGLNIPFADVALADGDAVIVERFEQPLFTVMGLVKAPGNFPYPPQAKYNLMQALAFAGGLDKVAEPRYATIYRLKADGTVVNTTFKIVEASKLTDALNTKIMPGDIIDVAQTPRTRRNTFLERIFYVNFGAYMPVFR